MKNGHLVAVAEDSLEDFEMIQLALQAEEPPVEILRFAYGDEALRFLTDPGERAPSLLLLDLNLPVTDGFGVMAALQLQPDPPPVVVLTTSGRDSDRQRAADLGARDYVVKPLDFDEFVEQVAAAKRRWLR